MAMQSSGATKHGVIQSSIALLQERFRQLQREKEMRERRQLLRNNTFISSSSPSSSSDSEHKNYHHNHNSHNNDHFKLLFADEVAVVRQPEFHPPSHHHHHQPVSLSLWPGGSSESYYATVDGGGRGENATAVLKGAKEEDCYKLYSSTYGFLGLDVKCDDSRVSDVDTSLHL